MENTLFPVVGVAGAGTMGLGIAQVAAMGGSKVILFDLNEEALKKAKSIIEQNLKGAVARGKSTEEDAQKTLGQISYTSNSDDLIADLIIEAIVEIIEVKLELFQKISSINSAKTILATNTSSIPITQIGRYIEHPERFLGIHFFNPAHIMKLVEVISGIATDAKVVWTVMEWMKQLGKVAVEAKDSPGFIVNRVARQFYTESLKAVEEQAADFKQIDRLMESTGFKMGPFRLMDLIGVDTNHSVTTSMFDQFFQEDRFRPSRIQRQYVEAGWHGRKTGKGFYTYE